MKKGIRKIIDRGFRPVIYYDTDIEDVECNLCEKERARRTVEMLAFEYPKVLIVSLARSEMAEWAAAHGHWKEYVVPEEKMSAMYDNSWTECTHSEDEKAAYDEELKMKMLAESILAIQMK